MAESLANMVAGFGDRRNANRDDGGGVTGQLGTRGGGGGDLVEFCFLEVGGI